MRTILKLAAAVLAAAFTASAPAAAAARLPTAQAETRAPVTILISIDGFRTDYLDPRQTPELSRLAAEGVHGVMRPAFPTRTFPNHYTLVTGLRPDRHGIVGNLMEDPGHGGAVFTKRSTEGFWWSRGEPIWVAAERAGIRSAVEMWPGIAAERSGARPIDWRVYDRNVADSTRIDAAIDWLRRPAATRPASWPSISRASTGQVMPTDPARPEPMRRSRRSTARSGGSAASWRRCTSLRT